MKMKGALTGRDGLIFRGVANLKEFGYPGVTPENILTDDIYKRFFVSMLRRKKLLRKAAYWLRDYAGCFNKVETPQVARFRDNLLKLARDCRKHAK